MGYMAQWHNQKLVSQGSRVRIQAVFIHYILHFSVFSLVFIKKLINDKSKIKINLFSISIVRAPHSYL